MYFKPQLFGLIFFSFTFLNCQTKLDTQQTKTIYNGQQRRRQKGKTSKGCRLYLYALAGAGQEGVERALNQYRTEIERGMKLMGCTKISDLNRNNLRFRNK